MKIAGIILLIGGIIELVFFSMLALNNSERISLLCTEIDVSTANWTPVNNSGVVTLIGLISTISKKNIRIFSLEAHVNDISKQLTAFSLSKHKQVGMCTRL